MMDVSSRAPKLVASTGQLYSRSGYDVQSAEQQAAEKTNDAPSHDEERSAPSAIPEPLTESDCFKSMQWSPDGTCILTNSTDNKIRTFVVPQDLLTPRESPHDLEPYNIIPTAESVYALAVYPFFSLSAPDTTLLLISIRDHPIRLSNALLPTSTPLASYPLTSPTTEAYLTPSALAFQSAGTHFLTGTDSLITLFDVSCPGAEPVLRLPTIPSKRHKLKGGGVGMRGIVSALALQSEQSVTSTSSSATQLLAAGTWTRWLGLYDAAGTGGTVANWSVAAAADVDARVGGAGVSNLLWSPCGRYLVVGERKAAGCLVYDVRVTGKMVCWLDADGVGRNTNQRLGLDMFDGPAGSEVWAGGADGRVRVWEGVGMAEGAIRPTWEWQAYGMAVSGCGVHASGSVVASCSGERLPISTSFDDDEADIESDQSESIVQCDNSVKIWSLA